MSELPTPLQDVLAEYDAAQRRLEALGTAVDDAAWNARPRAGGWSAAECIVHLNVTSERFLTAIHDAMRQGAAAGLVGDDPVRVDFWGRALLWWLEPPYRLGSKTGAAFVPSDVPDRDTLLQQFASWQDALRDAIRGSRGLLISRITIASPFNERLRYSLTSAFKLIPCHQRRHLWQAERAVAAARGVQK